MLRYQDDAADTSESGNNAAAEIVGVEAIRQHQALVQEATNVTLSNSCVASIVRALPLPHRPSQSHCDGAAPFA